MRLSRLRVNFQADKRGFTLIELIVAVAIASILGLGVSTTVYQTLSVNASSTNRLVAVKQVENAVHYLSRDSQMAQDIQTGAEAGFPLILRWTEWEGTTHRITYSFQGDQLRRAQSINSGPPQELVIARDIDTNGGETFCQYNGGVLSFKITSAVTGFRSSTESRSFTIIPRAAQ
jgi:prepilin-type N-terminal cleavage/methylation domain-containing protein